MKTTVDFADLLLEKARRVAILDGTTVKALAEAGLRRVIDDREQRSKFRLRRARSRGKACSPARRRIVGSVARNGLRGTRRLIAVA